MIITGRTVQVDAFIYAFGISRRSNVCAPQKRVVIRNFNIFDDLRRLRYATVEYFHQNAAGDRLIRRLRRFALAPFKVDNIH